MDNRYILDRRSITTGKKEAKRIQAVVNRAGGIVEYMKGAAAKGLKSTNHKKERNTHE